ncbi:hypothetical protein HNQ79_001870 [Streptomyces candidus]|uniref:Uncharacterized protein n=1 Tax=Streptomyces candidus TaxID=67283 RepID=A0A7X0HFU6_9ACTN|nr:hypothetical protein [Streptomyces candidus]
MTASRYPENSQEKTVNPPRSPTICGTAVAMMVPSSAASAMPSMRAATTGPRRMSAFPVSVPLASFLSTEVPSPCTYVVCPSVSSAGRAGEGAEREEMSPPCAPPTG